jgi:hypothetical protein
MSIENSIFNMIALTKIKGETGVSCLQEGQLDYFQMDTWAGFFPAALSPESRFVIVTTKPEIIFKTVYQEVLALKVSPEPREILWNSRMTSNSLIKEVGFQHDKPLIVATFGMLEFSKLRTNLLFIAGEIPVYTAVYQLQSAALESLYRQN